MLEHIVESVFGPGAPAASTIVIAIGVVALLLLILICLAFYLSGPDRSGT